MIRKETNEHRRVNRGLQVMFIKAFSFCALFLFALTSTYAAAQELIKTGPFGKPIMVMDEGGNYSIPIEVYSDSEMEAFIPDITTPGWIWWWGAAFREKGTYSTYIYSHYKNDALCRREMIPAGHKNDPNFIEMCSELRYLRRLYFSRYAQKNRNCAGDSLNGQYGTIPSGVSKEPPYGVFSGGCFKLNTC